MIIRILNLYHLYQIKTKVSVLSSSSYKMKVSKLKNQKRLRIRKKKRKVFGSDFWIYLDRQNQPTLNELAPKALNPIRFGVQCLFVYGKYLKNRYIRGIADIIK